MSVALAVLLAGTVATNRLPEAVDAARAECGCQVVVAGTSLEAMAAANRVLEGRGVSVVRAAPGREAETYMRATLASTGADCALRMEGRGDGPWKLTAHGACGGGEPSAAGPAATGPAETPPVAVATAAPAPVATAPADPLVEALVALPDHGVRRQRLLAEMTAAGVSADRTAALAQALAVVTSLEAAKRTDSSEVRCFLVAALAADPDLRARAVAAAAAGEAAPEAVALAAPPSAGPAAATTPAETAARTAPAASVLRDYQRRRLVRDRVSSTFGSMGVYGGTGSGYVATVHTWGVFDGGGTPFDAPAFAQRIGDRSMADRLQHQRTVALAGGGVLVVGGVLLAVATWGPAMEDDGSIGLPIAGATGAIIGFYWPVYVFMRQEWVHNYYSADEADRRIESYNAGLRSKLGLTEDDVRDIDLQSRGPALELRLGVAPGGLALSGRF